MPSREEVLRRYLRHLVRLAERGALRTVRRGGLVYWAAPGGGVLDPRLFYPLYKLRDDTLRTLLHELGYLELVEGRDGVELDRDPRSDRLGALRLGGLEVEVRVGRLEASLGYSVDAGGRLRRGGSGGVGGIWLRLRVRGRGREALERLARCLDCTELVLEELVGGLRAFIEGELGAPLASARVSGTAEVEDCRLASLLLEARVELGGVEVRLRLERGRGAVRARLRAWAAVAPARSYLARALAEAGLGRPRGALLSGLPPCCDAVLDSERGVGLELEHSAAAPTYPSALRALALLASARRVLGEAVRRVLEALAGAGGERVGGALRFVEAAGRDPEALRLALAALSLDGLDRRLLALLAARAILEGAEEGAVESAVESPREALLEMLLSGRLRPAPRGGGYELALGDRGLSETLPHTHYRPRRLRRVVEALLSLALPREELEKVRRARAAR